MQNCCFKQERLLKKNISSGIICIIFMLVSTGIAVLFYYNFFNFSIKLEGVQTVLPYLFWFAGIFNVFSAVLTIISIGLKKRLKSTIAVMILALIANFVLMNYATSVFANSVLAWEWSFDILPFYVASFAFVAGGANFQLQMFDEFKESSRGKFIKTQYHPEWLSVVYCILTSMFYFAFWAGDFTSRIKDKEKDYSSVVKTILFLFIPFGWVFWCRKYGIKLIALSNENIKNKKKFLVWRFWLSIFFPFACPALFQRKFMQIEKQHNSIRSVEKSV